ncbi:hypothetical protein TVAG_241990 [Trichomonas vaginalis G3]|uniref:Uncharacterized protein n=1 Tax=Trichomonas vaginalis (strain ATCC PRA-98 / G3) TaxID=412133 RepID=A2GT00_TRIV3|nr:hypothetical protein TVAG_241990 [Trichomonas vaginalis G3]|eukprot:XP_001292647.1 hypothetical protein [Trichomonas vaginalis G3]
MHDESPFPTFCTPQVISSDSSASDIPYLFVLDFEDDSKSSEKDRSLNCASASKSLKYVYFADDIVSCISLSAASLRCVLKLCDVDIKSKSVFSASPIFSGSEVFNSGLSFFGGAGPSESID